MAARKKAAKRPKGVRTRTAADGTERFDALVKVGGKQISLGTCDTFDEAAALRHAYFKDLAKQGARVPRDTGVLTVRQLGTLCPMQEWDVDRWRARVLEMAEWADWPATEVGVEHVQIWIDQMATTPIKSGRGAGELPTRGTIHSALSLLRRVYRWARMPARKYVTHNPAEGVSISNSTDAKPKSKRNVLDYLRESEARRLIDAREGVIPLEAKTKFLTLMFSGARPSDAWRLRWERVDWSADSVQFTSAKTSHQETRDYVVHMLPQLKAALRLWWVRLGQPAEGLVFPSYDEHGAERVYPRGYDAGWSDKRERRHWEWTVDGERRRGKSKDVKVTPGWRTKMGIKRPVPLYALRHTCACQLLLGSPLFTGGRQWSREEVQSQLGHRDSKATEHYMLALGILGRRAAKESKAALRLQKGRE